MNNSPPPTLPSSASLSRIPSLDGLRALSIFLVVSLHSIQRLSLTHHVGWGWTAVFNGGSGVFIFFEISGFLITSLLLQEHLKRGTISLRGFYLRRVFRILPPLYFYIGVIVLLGVFGRLDLHRGDVVSAVFFFHNFDPHASMWSLEHLWSISVEEQFYLWWPFLLVFCMSRRGIKAKSTASIIPLAILIVSPFARVILGTQSNPLLHKIGTGYLNLDFLMFGSLVALLQHTSSFESLYRKATRIWWLPPAVMAVCSVLDARFQNYFNLPIGYTLNGAAIAMFLLWCTRNPQSAVGRVLNWGPIAKIGVLSYSIYLWQTLFLHHLNATVFTGALAWVPIFPFSWFGFLAAAAFSYYVVEQPSLRLRSRLIKSLHVYAAKRQLSQSNKPRIEV
jgi:peptidoglycan/LPS O-acetylase OafA/YrhL